MNRKREGSAGKGAKTDQQSNPEPFKRVFIHVYMWGNEPVA